MGKDMKKKKNFGLYGTNKRRSTRKNNKDIRDYESYDPETDDDDEYIVDYQTDDEYYGDDSDVYEYSDDYAEDNESYYEEGGEYPDDGEYYESEEYGEDYYYEENYDTEEEIGEDEIDDEDYVDTSYEGTDFYEDDDDDEVVFGPDVSGKEGISFAAITDRIKGWISNMTAFDAIVAATGVVVVVAVIVTLTMFLQEKNIDKQIEAIVPIGDELIDMGIVGDEGLIAMAGAAVSGQFLTEVPTEELPTVQEETQAESANGVNVSFVSVEKDLKVRFTDSKTGGLITGVAFEVTLTNSKGKQIVLKDDDKDGIIYSDNMAPGEYDAVVSSTDKYEFPTKPQKVTVKDKVEYVVINVQDEVKKESQINVSAEDTQHQDAVKEEVKLTDTVEWVEPTSTPIDGTEGYIIVDKNTIADPSKISMLKSSIMFDGLNVSVTPSDISLFVGGTAKLEGSSPENSENEKEKVEYSYKWESSENSVASVDGSGNVTANAKGNAKITYTLTKTTTPITYEGGETKESEIDETEYNKLKEEGKVEGEDIRKEEGDPTKYYRIDKTEKTKKYGSPVTETGSASCDVTVSENGTKSGTLELKKSADSCTVGATLTVSPAKLVYTKDDGSTQTVTEGFPTVTWSSADKTIATVDSNGVVTGVKAGSTTITGQVTVQNTSGSSITISADVSVTIAAASELTLTLDRKDNVYIAVGAATTLVATVSNYKEDAGVTWTTSDKNIATVDEKGNVTGVAAGKVTITATTNEKNADGKQVTAECIVVVNSDAVNDTVTMLKDKSGNQIYVKNEDGSYREAVYADYFTAAEFYIKTQGQCVYTGWQTINGKTYYFDKNGVAVTGTQIIQGVTYNFDSEGAIATAVNGSTFGIDISRHNGSIDWNAVKASGVDYAIIRCGYRGSATGVLIEDENFKKNIQGAAAAGLKIGVYVFSQAVNDVEAVKEASLAVGLVQGYKLTYPIFIDTESSGGRADRIDRATRTAVVNAFCQTVASAGYQAGVYASKSWYEDNLNMSALGNYKIWLAQYAAAPTYKGKYHMWQYSSKGKISGITGNVDLNLSYFGY